MGWFEVKDIVFIAGASIAIRVLCWPRRRRPSVVVVGVVGGVRSDERTVVQHLIGGDDADIHFVPIGKSLITIPIPTSKSIMNRIRLRTTSVLGLLIVLVEFCIQRTRFVVKRRID